jgi:hypothetical protein
VAPDLADHFEKSADWPRAIKYLRLAADRAGRRYAHREATALLQQALGLASKLPDADRALSETEILEKLAAIYVASFDMRAIETSDSIRPGTRNAGALTRPSSQGSAKTMIAEVPLPPKKPETTPDVVATYCLPPIS